MSSGDRAKVSPVARLARVGRIAVTVGISIARGNEVLQELAVHLVGALDRHAVCAVHDLDIS